MHKNNCPFKEYRQHCEKLNILDVYSNYFLFDFYCPADSAIHWTLFFPLWQGFKLQCEAVNAHTDWKGDCSGETEPRTTRKTT